MRVVGGNHQSNSRKQLHLLSQRTKESKTFNACVCMRETVADASAPQSDMEARHQKQARVQVPGKAGCS